MFIARWWFFFQVGVSGSGNRARATEDQGEASVTSPSRTRTDHMNIGPHEDGPSPERARTHCHTRDSSNRHAASTGAGAHLSARTHSSHMRDSSNRHGAQWRYNTHRTYSTEDKRTWARVVHDWTSRTRSPRGVAHAPHPRQLISLRENAQSRVTARE